MLPPLYHALKKAYTIILTTLNVKDVTKIQKEIPKIFEGSISTIVSVFSPAIYLLNCSVIARPVFFKLLISENRKITPLRIPSPSSIIVIR